MTEWALTIRQPWADLIMTGVKDVENRTWSVPSTLPQWYRCEQCTQRRRDDAMLYRGHWHGSHNGWMAMEPDGPFPFRLWVHAAKEPEPGSHASWASWILCDGSDERGAILGCVRVTGCHHADRCRETRSAYWPGRGERWEIFCSEWAEPDVWHWTLADPQPLDTPIPARGRQRLWTLDDDLVAQAGEQLARMEGVTS